jgi:hypothetical protein
LIIILNFAETNYIDHFIHIPDPTVRFWHVITNSFVLAFMGIYILWNQRRIGKIEKKLKKLTKDQKKLTKN